MLYYLVYIRMEEGAKLCAKKKQKTFLVVEREIKNEKFHVYVTDALYLLYFNVTHP